MRKRVINHVADTIFWYILYFLPVLAYLFFVVSAPFGDDLSDNIVPGPVKMYDYKIEAGSELVSNAGLIQFPICYNTIFTPIIPGSENMLGDGAVVGLPVGLFTYDVASSLPSFQSPFSFCIVEPSLSNADLRCTILNDVVISFPQFIDVLPQNFIFILGTNTMEGDGLYFFGPITEYMNISYLGERYIYEDMPYLSLTSYNFKQFVNDMGFEFATDNIIVNSLSDIFGTGGIMPMFDNDTPFIIFAWFIGVYLLHLLVDFILFIPRIAHKWMKDCTGGD